MTNELSGLHIAFVTANEGVEQAELTSPWEAARQAGAVPELIATEAGEVQAFQHLDKADRFEVDRTTREVSAEEFDALVLPGGVANADELRADEAAVALVRRFFDSGRPVAVICHGPWTIVEADRVRGRTMTSWPTLRTDIKNAGGNWIDEQVVVDRSGPNTLVSSRMPADLGAFDAALIDVFAHAGQTHAR
jgi:protease I